MTVRGSRWSMMKIYVGFYLTNAGQCSEPRHVFTTYKKLDEWLKTDREHKDYREFEI